MIKQFLKNFAFNLLAMAAVVIICLTVVGGLYLTATFFGFTGMVVEIVILCIVWMASITYHETKREMEDKK